MANRYINPVRQEYVSSFVPLPLDFLQEEMGRRQQRYDIASQSMSQAKDEFGSIPVALADVDSRNQIINDYFGNIDKEVGDKYGGDYGRAMNDIARRLGSFNADPRIAAMKERYEKQKSVENIITQATARGDDFAFDNSVFSRPTITDTGEVSVPDFQGAFQLRGDLEGYLNKTVVNRLSNDIVQDILTGSGRSGLLSYDVQKGVPQEEIESRITDHDVAAFLRANPYARKQFEGDPEGARQFIVDYAMSAVPSQVSTQYMRDPSYSNETAEPGAPVTRPGSVQLGAKIFNISKPSVKGDSTGASSTSGVVSGERGQGMPNRAYSKEARNTDIPDDQFTHQYDSEEANYWKKEIGENWEEVFDEMITNLQNSFVQTAEFTQDKIADPSDDSLKATLDQYSFINPDTGDEMSYSEFIKKLGNSGKDFLDTMRWTAVDVSGILSDGGKVVTYRTEGKNGSITPHTVILNRNEDSKSLNYRLNSQIRKNPEYVSRGYGEWVQLNEDLEIRPLFKAGLGSSGYELKKNFEVKSKDGRTVIIDEDDIKNLERNE